MSIPLRSHYRSDSRKRVSPQRMHFDSLEARTLLSQVDYFLSIPEIHGNATAAGHEGAIDVSSISWETMRPADFLGGAAAFAPLVVDSSISQASPLLFEAAAAATVYPTVTLSAARMTAGVLNDFATWTLTNAVVASYQSADGAESYGLDYTKVDMTYQTTSSDGSMGVPVDASWNLATQGGALTAPANLAPTGPAVAASYFLDIPQVPGDSTAEGHQGAIDVGSMSWGVTAGQGAGPTAFAPLVVDSSINQTSPVLFQAAAAGTVYPNVTLSAAKMSAGVLEDFVTWTLSNVTVASYQSADGAERYALDYTKAEMTYELMSSSGGAVVPVDASWDLAAQGGTVSSPSDLAAGPPLAASYFLDIAGVSGSSTAQGHQGAIDVGSMSWGVTEGPPAGPPSFAPLAVDSSLSQASPLLFEAAAAGTLYPTVTLSAARMSAGILTEFATWTLSNVTIASYQSADGAELYALDYTKADMTYFPSASGGNIGTPVDGSWDLAAQGGTMTAPKDLAALGHTRECQLFPEYPRSCGRLDFSSTRRGDRRRFDDMGCDGGARLWSCFLRTAGR